MKYSLFVILLFTGYVVSGQKIFSDKKDPFTGERTIITDAVPALSAGGSQAVQLYGQVKVTDTTKQIAIFVSGPHYGSTTTATDSIKREFLIKLENGKVLTGRWLKTTDNPGSGMMPAYVISSYEFKKDDIAELATSKATDLKITGGNDHQLQFSVSPSKNQSKIKDLATLLLKYL